MWACSESQHDPRLQEKPGVLWDGEVSHVCFPVSESGRSGELCSVWSTTWRDTLGGHPCGGQKVGWSRKLKWCPIKSYWKKKRSLDQRRLWDAVAISFKNGKDFFCFSCATSRTDGLKSQGRHFRSMSRRQVKSQSWPKMKAAALTGHCLLSEGWLGL